MIFSNTKYHHTCHMCETEIFSEFLHCNKCNIKRLGKIGTDQDPCAICKAEILNEVMRSQTIEVRAF